MWPFPNPFFLFGHAVSGVAGWAWEKVIQGIYTWFASGLLILMEWVWSVLDTASTPRLTDEWFDSGLVQPLAAISLGITVAMMLASAVQAGFGGRPELVIDALKEGPKAIVASALTIVVMDVLIRGADAISGTVWQTGRAEAQEVLDSVASVTASAGVLAGTFLGPLALLFGMVGLMMTALVLFMRSSMLYLVAAFAPIVWASSVSPVMRGSGRRLVHVTVALVLAKPAITITLVVGTKLLANAGASGVNGQSRDGAAALGTLISGFACIGIAGLSPWVVYRLLPSVEQASVASGVAGGWGRAGMTAVQAGLMVKSLGASAAASAATRPVSSMSSMSSMSSTGQSGGGSPMGGAPSPTSGSAASRRPPVPAPTPPPPDRDDGPSTPAGRVPAEAR